LCICTCSKQEVGFEKQQNEISLAFSSQLTVNRLNNLIDTKRQECIFGIQLGQFAKVCQHCERLAMRFAVDFDHWHLAERKSVLCFA
jgi:hypothetical protein